MKNVFRWFPLAAVFVVALTACVTTEQRPDGSTTINIPSILQRNPSQPTAGTNQTFTSAKPAVVPNQSSTVPVPKVGTIQSTALANLFTKYPFDGYPKNLLPQGRSDGDRSGESRLLDGDCEDLVFQIKV